VVGRSIRFLGFCLAAALALPSTARAQAEDPTAPPTAEQAALEASEVQADYCSDVEAADPETQAKAIEAAAPVYGRVSAAYRTYGSPFLLYWRGLLADCLSKEEQARGDYTAFVEASEDDPTYAPQVADARRRLNRLQGGGVVRTPSDGPSPAAPGIVLAVGGGAAAAVGAGLNGGTYASLAVDLDAGTWTGSDEDYQSALSANRAGLGMVVGGAAAATAGVVAAIALASRSSGDRRRASIAPVVSVADGHVIVGIGGLW
jgi:hypothetical protein